MAEAVDRAATWTWATDLVEEAGRRAVAMADGGGMNVTLKSNGTLVTDIDREIERFLRAALHDRFPSHAVLGEEFGYEAAGDDAPLWAIDPIDGTTNLANALPYWCVSLALIEGDSVTVGVLAAPRLSETWSAASSLGATLNGRPLPRLASGGPTEGEDPYGICSTSARTRDLSRLSAKFRILGSAALDVAYVGAGRLRGCQTIGVSVYDVAGGACIAQECGAELRWLESGELWSPREHAAAGSRSDRALVTAPPATMAHLRDRLL